jgi:hypothetical protein
MQERQQIVEVRTYEFGTGGGNGGSGGSGAGGTPGGGAPRGPSLGRIVLRVLAVLIFAAIAIPAIALGLTCLVLAVLVGLAVWLARSLLRAVRGGGPGRVTGGTQTPTGGGDDLRENVRVRAPRE